MKAILITVILMLLAGSVSAQLGELPDTTILVSDIYDMKVVDTCVVAITRQGVSSFVFNRATSAFEFQQIVLLDLDSAGIKYNGDLLVVADATGEVHFFDISDLPNLSYLGTSSLDIMLSDFALDGTHLYVSTWFDGIWRYSLDNYSQAAFVDSSMIGIFITQLDVVNDTLYALDEYNGVLRYDLSVGGFGSFIDYLYVPRRASAYTRCESDFYLLYQDGAYVADFSASPPIIVDSITGIGTPHQAYTTDSLLILVFESDTYFLDRDDPANQTVYHSFNNRFLGDFFELEEETYFLLPEEDGGVTMFNLDDGASASAGLHREGTVKDMLIYDDKLFSAGWSLPVDVHDIDNGNVNYHYTIYDDWDSTALMLHNGDTLFTLAANTNTVNFFVNSTNPNQVYLDNAFYARVSAAVDVKYLDTKINGYRVMLTVNVQSVEVWSISDSAEIRLASTWDFTGADIGAAAVKGDVVYLEGGNKVSQVMAYGFDANFDPILYSTVGVTTDPIRMVVSGDYLYAFQQDLLRVIDISTPSDPSLGPVISLPYTILDAEVYGSWIFGIGSGGIAVFDIVSTTPAIVDQAGLGGNSLAIGSDILAASCGDGVNIYQVDTTDIPTTITVDSLLPYEFSLSQNYPNPFNLETTISYGLQRRAAVDLSIYNVLGQKVRTLVSETQSAGIYTIQWDGTTSSGNVVASGVYFYVLTTDETSRSKKMILLK